MRRDADNVGFARKFVLDGLVAAGVIKDDSRKYVEQCPDRVLTDRARPRGRGGERRVTRRDKGRPHRAWRKADLDRIAELAGKVPAREIRRELRLSKNQLDTRGA